MASVSKRQGENNVPDGLSLQQSAGEKIAVAGETGSGKTTLLKIIGGLVGPDEGTIFFEGRRVKGPDERLIAGEPGIAYLSQQFEFPNHYRVEEILQFENRLPERDATTLYELCRIDHLMKRMNTQVSGGERQRIALARLLISSPRLLLLDEPFSNLDAIHKSILRSVLLDLGERLGISCLLVSHDGLDVLSWADKIAVMKEGRIVQSGTPSEVYHRPQDTYVAGLFGEANFINPSRQHIFSNLFKEKQGRTAMIRPENFLLADEGPSSIPGIIRSINFFGSYTDLDIVLANNFTVTLRVQGHHPAKGGSVFISLRPDGVWWMQ